ncbi:MAG: formylglycine-generating enzyme family protein [Anaerolineae bacterium]
MTALVLWAALLLAPGSGAAASVELRCPDASRMVLIPAGPFWMGSDEAERQLARSLSSDAVRRARWFEAELAHRQVSLPTYCLDRHLVTQSDYAAFIMAEGRKPPGITRAEYRQQGFLVHDYDRTWTRFLWRDNRPPAGWDDHPVVLVSAEEAEAYCRWRGLRLPTEAEWEKGARGTDGRPFPWGAGWDPDRLNSAERGPGRTTPVGRYSGGLSPFGLFDAVGDVFQWTSTSLRDPRRRVVKSCAWDDEAGLCRPAFRHARPASSRHILIGFRCAGRPFRP